MLILPTITAGALEALSSGTLVCNASDRITIVPVPQTGIVANYHVEIVFAEENPLLGPNINTRVVRPGVVEVVVNGTSHPAGMSTSKPIYVGAHVGRKLYLTFASFTIGQDPKTNSRLFAYTFYLGESGNV
jgi:hypothetical protein